jgi:hypothetical protein
MDPQRNEKNYLSMSSNVISEYLGDAHWRELRRKQDAASSFDLFIAKTFDAQMKSIGYSYGGKAENVLIRTTDKNAPLYRLGFYSKHPLAEKYWKETKKYSDPQMSLF